MCDPDEVFRVFVIRMTSFNYIPARSISQGERILTLIRDSALKSPGTVVRGLMMIEDAIQIKW